MATQSSLDENLIAAGLNTSDPANTYVDFGEAVAKNQREQASHEQAIKLAKEHVAQARLQTKQGAEADAAGVNPQLMDVMTPEQAEKYLKIIMQAKGLEIEQKDIDAWIASLNGPVNRQVVESFANRFARESTRFGQPVKFDQADAIQIPEGSTAASLGLIADKTNPSIGHVPEDGMYQVVVDNQGVVKKFVPGGKEPVDPQAKLDLKHAESAEKQWQKLDTTINTAFKTRSGGLGSLSTAIFRSVRAINTINATPNITAQDLANISQDIAGIFQGGAPTVVTARDNDYSTIFTHFADTFRKYTGILPSFKKILGGKLDPLSDTKEKLLQVLVDLRDSSIANLKTFVESEFSAYKQIIEEDPDRWDKMKADKLKFIESGLLVPAGANTKLNITGMEHAEETKHPTDKPKSKDDDAKAALRKKLGLPDGK